MKAKSFVIIITCILLIACKSNRHSQSDEETPINTESLKQDDFDNINQDNSFTEEFVQEEIKSFIVDRKGIYSIDDYELEFTIYQNGDSITDYYSRNEPFSRKYADHSLILSLKKGDRFIIENRHFNKTDFIPVIPVDEIEFYQIISLRFEKKEEVVVEINVCKPDSGICYLLELNFSEDGTYIIQEIDYELGEEY